MVNIEWGLTSTHILPVDHGLINRTWRIRTPSADYILQNVNTIVFNDPTTLQAQLVVLSKQMLLPNLVPLTFLPTLSGKYLHTTSGHSYRISKAITPAITILQTTPENATLAAQALLEFHKALDNVVLTKDWKAPIAGFLDVQSRNQAFETAKLLCSTQRLDNAKATIERMEAQLEAVDIYKDFLAQGQKELIHADPKLSNFLFHPNGKTVRSLIDWDTIQFGNRYYDFADMVRSYCSKGEDEPASNRIFKPLIFEALRDTFKVDDEQLVMASKGVILVQALRFLTDYLSNDRYYRVKDETHNLRRAVNQLTLAEELQSYWATTRRQAQ